MRSIFLRRVQQKKEKSFAKLPINRLSFQSKSITAHIHGKYFLMHILVPSSRSSEIFFLQMFFTLHLLIKLTWFELFASLTGENAQVTA